MDNPRMHNRCVQLMENTGYTIVQRNNVRIYYRPNSTKLPQQGSEIFVGHIPRDMFEDKLVPILEGQGAIYKLRLPIGSDGLNCGFCFVQYYLPHHAQRAMRNIDKLEITAGHRVSVTKAFEARRLFIGGLPKDKTLIQIWAMLETYIAGIQNVIVCYNKRKPQYNRGFAFVEFATREDAADAMRKISCGPLALWNREISVNWAMPQVDADPAVMARVKILFVSNLGFNITALDLKRFLERFDNSITKICKKNDYAFVHFTTRRAAETCFEAIAGTLLGNTIIEVSWARPRYFDVLARGARANRRS